MTLKWPLICAGLALANSSVWMDLPVVGPAIAGVFFATAWLIGLAVVTSLVYGRR